MLLPKRPLVTGLVAAALLTACGSGVVPSGSGSLKASASTTTTSYLFDCDPAAQGGPPLVIADDMQFTCPSVDGHATLTVLTHTVPGGGGNTGSGDPSPPRPLVSAVLTVTSPTVASYAAAGTLTDHGVFLNRSTSGSFDLHFPGGGPTTGTFRFTAP